MKTYQYYREYLMFQLFLEYSGLCVDLNIFNPKITNISICFQFTTVKYPLFNIIHL